LAVVARLMPDFSAICSTVNRDGASPLEGDLQRACGAALVEVEGSLGSYSVIVV